MAADVWAPAQATAFLNYLFRGVSMAASPTLNGPPWIQLHKGPPGPAGTANLAANTNRYQPTFGAPTRDATTGVVSIKNTNAINFTPPATENLTEFSVWSLQAGGVYLRAGTVQGLSVTQGQPTTIAVGALVINMFSAT